MSPCPAPLSSKKVLRVDLGLGLGLPGMSILGQSLDCSDPQLSLLRITGWEAEETDPLDLALLFGTAVGAANNAALVRHGKLAMVTTEAHKYKNDFLITVLMLKRLENGL